MSESLCPAKILHSLRQGGWYDSNEKSVVGVGLGGTLDTACELAKKTLFRKIGSQNKVSQLKKLETDVMREVNRSNIGPLGFGGKTTVLDIFAAEYPTHIAGLPVAVNISCHALRTANIIL